MPILERVVGFLFERIEWSVCKLPGCGFYCTEINMKYFVDMFFSGFIFKIGVILWFY